MLPESSDKDEPNYYYNVNLSGHAPIYVQPYSSRTTNANQMYPPTYQFNQNTYYDEPNAYVFTQYNLDDAENVKNIRHRFIMKTYIILFFQLLITFGITTLFVFQSDVKQFVQANVWVLWLAIILSFVSLISLVCCSNLARTKPWNYILLSVFTLLESYLVGAISSFYDTQSVMLALIITLVVTIGLTLFAIQTKWDFTGWGPYLLGVLLVLIAFGFMNTIFCYFGSSGCQILNTVYAAAGALIFSMFIVYDTQLIVGGKHKKYEYSTDDHVFAALSLYLDVVNLFLYVLQLIGGGGSRGN